MKGRYFLILPIVIYALYELYMFNQCIFWGGLSLYFVIGLIIYIIRTSYLQVFDADILIDRYYILKKGFDESSYNRGYDFDEVYKRSIFKSIKKEPNIFFKIPLIIPVIIVGAYKLLEEVLNYLDRHLSIFTNE